MKESFLMIDKEIIMGFDLNSMLGAAKKAVDMAGSAGDLLKNKDQITSLVSNALQEVTSNTDALSTLNTDAPLTQDNAEAKGIVSRLSTQALSMLSNSGSSLLTPDVLKMLPGDLGSKASSMLTLLPGLISKVDMVKGFFSGGASASQENGGITNQITSLLGDFKNVSSVLSMLKF